MLELVAVQRRAEQLALEPVGDAVRRASGSPAPAGAGAGGAIGARADRRVGCHLEARLGRHRRASLRGWPIGSADGRVEPPCWTEQVDPAELAGGVRRRPVLRLPGAARAHRLGRRWRRPPTGSSPSR